MPDTFGEGTFGQGSFGGENVIYDPSRTYSTGTYGSGTYGAELAIPPDPAPPSTPPVITPIPAFIPGEPKASVYKLYVRDGKLNRVAEVTDFDSFEAIIRYNDLGTWSLTIPASTPAAQYLKFVNNLSTEYLTPGIILTRDGDVLMSGVVKKKKLVTNDKGDKYTFSGVDDNGLLADRDARPNRAGQDYSSQISDNRTGDASSVLMHFVRANAGDQSERERPIPGLILGPNYGYGKTVSGQAQWQTLLALLQAVSADGGVRFRLHQPSVGANYLQFDVDHASDRTGSIIFSRELGTIASATIIEEVSAINAIVGGGKGEGVLRSFSEDRDDRSIRRYGRIERFQDIRDVENAFIHDRIDAMLDQLRERLTVSVVPVETATTQFGRTYGLGDIVTLKADDLILQPTINQVKITIDDNGAVILPELTTSPAAPPNAFGGVAKALETRISTIERTTGTPTAGYWIETWKGSLDQLPSTHVLCDGNNGTPDLRDAMILGAGNKFAVGAHDGTATSSGETGNAKSSSSYTKTFGSLSSGSDIELAKGEHRHIMPYYALAFVMRKK